MDVTGSRVLDNHVQTDGGGIYNGVASNEAATMGVTGSRILANRAGTDGGGIYTARDGTVTLTSTVADTNHPDNCAPADSVPNCTG